MKKITALFIIFALVVIMTGCAESIVYVGDSEFTVLCTVFPIADIVREIAGEHVSYALLSPSGANTHSYEPTPADIKAIGACDLFIYIGGESDYWADEVLKSLGKDAPMTLKLIDCSRDSLIAEYSHDHDHDHDHDEELYDEHIWTSPKIYQKMVFSVSHELGHIVSPEAAADIETEAVRYNGELDALDAQFRTIADSADRHTLVFGDRFPFKYLAEEYGFDYIAAFDGCGEDTEPSAAVVAQIIDYVKANDIPVVFCMSESSDKIAKTICAETSAELLTLHSFESCTSAQMADGATYITLMKENAENIRLALIESHVLAVTE